MALKLFIPDSQVGAPFADAYAKISHYHGWTHVLVAHIAIYANMDARFNNAQPVDTRTYEMPVPADGPLLPAIYAYLKGLPEYAGAVDC